MGSKFDVFAISMFLATILVFMPLIPIWVLNTLFSLGIAYNFWTWLASLFMLMILKRR